MGINILSIAPHVVILDTRNMARDIPGPISTRLGGRTPISSFTLSAILAALGYSHDEADLHNARNDATYALFALLGLAVRSSQAKRLNNAESARLEHLVRITAPARSRGGLAIPSSGDVGWDILFNLPVQAGQEKPYIHTN